ncbi:class I SAM-dependent methyltransferase [Streptomyces sp. NPDC051677]|uniref:class I SAM-dependent methyltransferase n=1 Tax=Streptomyces sp. NPDC051677 TaxID=3365669 RepID=UPI0037D53952
MSPSADDGYIPGTYWERVARRVSARDGEANVIAGDDTTFYRRKRELFLERLLAPATEGLHEVLEVGCGPGGNLAWLAGRGMSVAGADVSPTMLEHVRRLLPDVPLTHIDGRQLPFADRSFEAVMTATVLQHNPPDGAGELLTEIARVADREVHLFEDTAWLCLRDRQSHWLRLPRWYVRRMAEVGFVPVVQERLPLAAQEVAAALVRAAGDRGHHEGERVTSRRQRVEVSLGQAASVVDAVLPTGVGLTRMSFRRAGAPSGEKNGRQR